MIPFNSGTYVFYKLSENDDYSFISYISLLDPITNELGFISKEGKIEILHKTNLFVVECVSTVDLEIRLSVEYKDDSDEDDTNLGDIFGSL